MEHIKIRWFYTELVEHYLRMAVRYNVVSKASSQEWFDTTKEWIDSLSDNDREFIQFVFDKQFFSTAEGLYCYQRNENMYVKRERLAELEKAFALKSGLIGTDSTVTH